MKIFGIRHHGPGSAKTLLQALETMQPDCILIEGPSDANDCIQYVDNFVDNLNTNVNNPTVLVPPVAILVYNPKDFAQANYFPLAEFSPEWQALLFSKKNNITARFFDLPYGIQLDIERQNTENQLFEYNNIDENDLKMVFDPLSYMAQLAGYEDSERWWEITFENQENDANGIFDAILEMITALRNEKTIEESPLTLAREAFMRKCIRDAVAEGFKNIAIVCGAWHSPALSDLSKIKASSDNQILKTYKKIITKSTWIPWTYERLARKNRYGAGIISPAWYDLLFRKPQNSSIHWMTQVAQLLRAEDLSASSAHVIDAVRLADTLASMRYLRVAGIEELRAAAIVTLCEGNEMPLMLIDEQLIIGNRMGTVPASVPVVPLQHDIQSAIKKARLTKERDTSTKIDKILDLRKDSNLFASQLLHRLQILNIYWGTEKEASKFMQGGFSEHWQLKWIPDFALRIIEMGVWGNTLHDAASAFVTNQIEHESSLEVLTSLMQKTLKADLKSVIGALLQRLQALTTATIDVLLLIDALTPLVSIVRYGSTRNADINNVQDIVNQLITKICLILPSACTNTDEDASRKIFDKIISANHAIGLLNDENFNTIWHHSLLQIAQLNNVNGLLLGATLRILFDKNQVNSFEVSTAMHYIFSNSSDALSAAYWLEGFLFGSGLLLIYNPTLWLTLDEWVATLSMEKLETILPILRRTFSSFPPSERQKMLQLATKKEHITTQASVLNKKNMAKMLPILQFILNEN